MSSSHQSLSHLPENLPDAGPFRFGIVVADWNKEITEALLDGALDALEKAGANMSKVVTVRVPGSFELSAGAAILTRQNRYDAIICLGCVIQGETRHFDFICQAVANGLTNLSLQTGLPVIFGVLTTNDMQQARERAGGKYGNKGFEAGVTAVQMAALSKSMS